jgi:hypothetical protein
MVKKEIELSNYRLEKAKEDLETKVITTIFI